MTWSNLEQDILEEFTERQPPVELQGMRVFQRSELGRAARSTTRRLSPARIARRKARRQENKDAINAYKRAWRMARRSKGLSA